MKRYYYISLLVLLLCGLRHTPASATQQNYSFSYVYIQGDKDIPFYVKLENEMLARYGKNYNIISELAPGTVHIQILFQQNAYPAQSFTIQIPENGFRGFLLTRKNETFSLYDIHQQFYLPAGNKASDDRLPNFSTQLLAPQKEAPPAQAAETAPKPATPVTTTPATTPAATVAEKAPLQKSEPAKKEPEIASKPAEAMANTPAAAPAIVNTPEPAVPAKPTPAEEVKPKPEKRSRRMVARSETPQAINDGAPEPKFLEDISLKNDKTLNDDHTVQNPGMRIINSDCPEAIGRDDFAAIRSRVDEKSGEDKLKYLLTRMDQCYSTEQVRDLSRMLQTDTERYTFLKRVYPRTTDQFLFPILEKEFTDAEWKGYFRSLIKK